MINNNDRGLYSNIESALAKAMITIPNYDIIQNDDGSVTVRDKTVPLLPDLSSIEMSAAKMVKFDGVSAPLFGSDYNSSTTDGMRKIIESISKETLSYIIQNAEVASKARYDELENDYNNLLLAIQTASTGIASTPQVPVTNGTLGAILNAILLAGGTGLRSAKTSASKLANEMLNGYSIDIK